MDVADLAAAYLEESMSEAFRRIDDARLQRAQQALEAGGICAECSHQIPSARLQGIDTNLCVDCAEVLEKLNR